MNSKSWKSDRVMLAEAVDRIVNKQPYETENAEDSQLSYADWLQQWSQDAGTELHLNLDQPFVELLDEYRNHGGKDNGLSAAKQHRELQSQYGDDQVSTGMKAQTDRIIRNNTDPNAGMELDYSDGGGM